MTDLNMLSINTKDTTFQYII